MPEQAEALSERKDKDAEQSDQRVCAFFGVCTPMVIHQQDAGTCDYSPAQQKGQTMYFEINISRNGRHLFATASRSITDEEKARELYRELKKKFDDCEVTVTYWQKTGQFCDFDVNKGETK